MRSIGKVKIKKLKAIVGKVFAKDLSADEEDVIEMVPAEWFDTWEMAWQEIHQIVSDELMNLRDALRESI
jgi:hypothetical protein